MPACFTPAATPPVPRLCAQWWREVASNEHIDVRERLFVVDLLMTEDEQGEPKVAGRVGAR